MNVLSSFQLRTVADYHAEHCKRHLNVNRGRFYKYLFPDGDDMEIHTIACKYRRDGSVVAKEVVRASVDDPFQHVKDVACMAISGYVVDWSPEKIGRPRDWSYNGRWESEAYAPRCKWKIACEVVNPEALLDHPRFRYCSWSWGCGDILDYLKVFAKNPRIELLAKAGLGRFGSCSGFAKRLASDKRMARFLMENAEEVKECCYGCDVIGKAYRDGSTLAEADTRIRNRRHFRAYGLPPEVDASKAMAYKRGLSEYDYCRYLQNCKRLGLDLLDTKNAFPRRFKQRAQVIADQCAELDRKARAELAKQQDQQIAATATRFARLERRTSALRYTIPRKTAELIREGKRMSNCLGNGHYAAKMARGETLIVFVRRAERPNAAFVAVEFSPDQKRVLQCYAAKNGRPPEPVIRSVKKWFEGATKTASRLRVGVA
jgi:hypothetical protein